MANAGAAVFYDVPEAPKASLSRQLADHIFGGYLKAKLQNARAAGYSYEWIAEGIEDEIPGVTISRETVRRWCKELSIP